MVNTWHPAINFVPHRPPMMLVDFVRLVNNAGEAGAENSQAEVKSIVKPEWPVLNPAGRVMPTAFFEVAAQSFAAMAGLQLSLSGANESDSRLGFLVALKRFNFYGDAGIGDELLTSVSITASLGEFSVVQGEIRLQGQLLAEGQLKVYCPTADEVQHM
ncbi:hypothetical protein LJB93_03375, partial [Desulfovibrio sp. OttesenSCG-928-F07]|nr:hypothetical protein [Desulfovibrio sp. OttesenSCG-928-F07]